MLDQVVTVPILKEVLSAFRVDMVREIREETRALIAASENRIVSQLRGEMRQMKREIIGEITDFIDSAILPQIADLQREVAYIKRHVGLAT